MQRSKLMANHLRNQGSLNAGCGNNMGKQIEVAV